jgi:tetratricopeptide (TPR) repeat protein
MLEYAEASVYVDLSSDRLLLEARDVFLAGDVQDAVRAGMILGEYRWLRGDSAGADEHFRHAEGLADRMSDESAKLRVLANLSRFAMLADDDDRAVGIGRQALMMAEKLGRDDMRAAVLNNIGVARMSQGDAAGLADLEASRDIAHAAGGPEYVRACGNLASVLLIQGELQRAAELHREALAVSRAIGYEEPTKWLETEIAIDHLLVGDWAEARRINDELIPGYESSPFWIEPQTRVCRARMLFAEGAVADAILDADRAVELVVGSNVFQSYSGPRALRARFHAELEELDDASRLVRDLIAAWTKAFRSTRTTYCAGRSPSGASVKACASSVA